MLVMIKQIPNYLIEPALPHKFTAYGTHHLLVHLQLIGNITNPGRVITPLPGKPHDLFGIVLLLRAQCDCVIGQVIPGAIQYQLIFSYQLIQQSIPKQIRRPWSYHTSQACPLNPRVIRITLVSPGQGGLNALRQGLPNLLVNKDALGIIGRTYPACTFGLWQLPPGSAGGQATQLSTA